MPRTRLAIVSFTLVASGAIGLAEEPAARWWSHVSFLADDRLKGRETGSPEHREAAEYIAKHFKDAGLKPGGTNGYFQPVPFRSRRIVEPKSSLAIVRGGQAVPVTLGDEATFSMRIDPAPHIEAPMVFAGYGLQIPEAKHDDLAGLDLKGKVVLLVTGGPSSIPGPLLAHYQNTRWSYLKQAGAVGVVSIQNPKGQDIPWDRSKLARFLPSMVIADPALDETVGQQLAVTVNPATAEKFFEGTGHTFNELLALSNAGAVLPRFAVPASIRATVAVETQTLTSDNVVGVLPGTDPALRNEYVVVSAHLDHIGVGTMKGDAIYNGAMDNATGIATLIETAAAAAAKKGFKRSVIFLAVTAEEKGLLGSRYFANRPTVPPASIVADLNTDMYLPIQPLTGVFAYGWNESDLGKDILPVLQQHHLANLEDPEPEQVRFIRSDQYSFIQRGIPALAFKVGYTKDSPGDSIVTRWLDTRYHEPSDDVAQPVNFETAIAFDAMYFDIVRAVADRPTRPAWYPTSVFASIKRPGQ